MTGIPGAAVRTAQRPMPAIGAADVVRDLDLNKYLFWADSNWVDPAGAAVNTAAFVQVPPVLSPAQVGLAITCPTGTWAGYPAPTFTYQWKLAGQAISGATSASYTPVQSDAAQALSCTVTATNSSGARSVDTNAVIVAQPAALATVTPVTFRAGSGAGTLAANISVASPGTKIRLQQSNSLFKIPDGQLTVQVGSVSPSQGDYPLVVIATSPDGRTTAQIPVTLTASAPSGVPSPVNTAAPAITGTAQVGQTLTASQGSWSNSPSSYAYQWTRAGSPISGATASTYSPIAADVGSTLTVTVTATNAGGSAAATSAPTSAIIAAAAPSPTLGAVTVSPASATVGVAFTGSVTGLTSGSSPSLSGTGSAGLSISGNSITGTPTTAGPVNVVEALSGATNSPRTTSGAVTVSAASSGSTPGQISTDLSDPNSIGPRV